MTNIYEIQRIKQVKVETDQPVFTVRSPQDAVEIVQHFIGDEDREVFLVLVLNTKNEVVAVNRCHIGNLNSAIADPRDIFKAAILNNAASIIASHVHPSGNPEPSSEDRHVTQRLSKAGKLLGVELLDHIVVGGNSDKYYSFKEKFDL